MKKTVLKTDAVIFVLITALEPAISGVIVTAQASVKIIAKDNALEDVPAVADARGAVDAPAAAAVLEDALVAPHALDSARGVVHVADAPVDVKVHVPQLATPVVAPLAGVAAQVQ